VPLKMRIRYVDSINVQGRVGQSMLTDIIPKTET